MSEPKPADLLKGTLDLLVLRALSHGSMHGYGIAMRIRQLSAEALEVQQGSLYPALQRLEQGGHISSEWGPSDNNRRARFYSLTRSGRKRLEVETGNWERIAAAIALVLKSEGV